MRVTTQSSDDLKEGWADRGLAGGWKRISPLGLRGGNLAAKRENLRGKRKADVDGLEGRLIPFFMPKRQVKKDSEYLRFRPYRAFTTPVEEPRTDRSTIFWRAVLLVGGAVVIFLAAMSLARH
jgi:hypothetical protein